MPVPRPTTAFLEAHGNHDDRGGAATERGVRVESGGETDTTVGVGTAQERPGGATLPALIGTASALALLLLFCGLVAVIDAIGCWASLDDNEDEFAIAMSAPRHPLPSGCNPACPTSRVQRPVL